MSKEQFDKYTDLLARKAAEQYSIPYTEEAWHKMEELLNKKKKRRVGIFWWLLGGVILLSMGIFFMSKPENKIKSTATANKHLKGQDAIQEKRNDKLIVNVREESISKQSAFKKLLSDTLQLNKGINKVTNKQKNIAENKNVFNKNEQLVQTNKVGLGIFKSETNLLKKKNSGLEFYANDSLTQTIEYKDNPSKKYAPQEQQFVKAALQNISLKVLNNRTVKYLDNELTKNNFISTNPVSTSKRESFLHKLDIGVMLLSDITTINFKQVNQLSTGVGLFFTYPIFKRWSVTSGLAIAKKVYSADSTNYNYVNNLGSRYYLTNIDAVCTVYEIPILLNYTIKAKAKESYLLSAGLSSYLMRKEAYDYTYLYNGEYVKYAYLYENQNKHILSVLALSASYKRSINKSFSYQLTPYARLPLTGVGNGKVKLYSIGLGVSLHYNK
jgi:Fe-S cluster assembly iron-binding protein IscA